MREHAHFADVFVEAVVERAPDDRTLNLVRTSAFLAKVSQLFFRCALVPRGVDQYERIYLHQFIAPFHGYVARVPPSLDHLRSKSTLKCPNKVVDDGFRMD